MIWSSGSSPSPCSTSCWRTDRPVFGRGLKTLSILSVALVTLAFALAFFYAPEDADQGIRQKIFYLHVPLAIVSLCGFVAGGVFGTLYLRTRARAHDLRSSAPIHLPWSLGVGVRLTGAFWPRPPGGTW